LKEPLIVQTTMIDCFNKKLKFAINLLLSRIYLCTEKCRVKFCLYTLAKRDGPKTASKPIISLESKKKKKKKKRRE